MFKTPRQLRDEISVLVRQYHDVAFAPQPFLPGNSNVPVSGKVFDASELEHLVEASLDGWLTTGRFAAQFERDFAAFMGVRCASLVNSGSSANLVALSCLTSPSLGDRRLRAGDEVITVAAGFPTTVNPIIQNGLVPVFVDVRIPSYDVDITQLEAAVSDRTRAVILAHTLGNPFDLDAVMADTPGRLKSDIHREGILLCGGGARLEGLDAALATATRIEVHRDSQPQLCAVRGTGYALDNLDVLKRALMYIR